MSKTPRRQKPKTQTLKAGFFQNESTFPSFNATYFMPLPDDHPCYRMIGLIAAEAARIERLIDQATCNVADIDMKVGACFTGQMNGPVPRFNALWQLAVNRDMTKAIVDRIDKLSGHASGEFEKRNRAVHDAWLVEGGTGKSYQFKGKPRRSADFGHAEVSDKELEATLKALRSLREKVTTLVADIWKELNGRA